MIFEDLGNEIKGIFNNLEKEDIKDYALLKYPHHLSMMKMKVEKYNLNSFGSIMIMNTNMMNIMKLTTISFTPYSGINAPFLLVDTMSMGKKRLAFVEFYNTTNEKYSNIEELKNKYKDITEYKEKDAWYINERMEGSLIKCGTKNEEDKLISMIIDSIKEYKNAIDNNSYNESNIEKLDNFRTRMIKEGNPSSKTLNKVLGEEKAIDFFKKIIMPIEK